MSRRALIGFPLVLLALVLLALFREPLAVPAFYITLLSTFFFWTAQATSWNILSGYSGYFSFGQGAFAGVGIYATAVLTAKHGWSFYVTLPVAAGLACLLALGIGALAFRLGAFRGATFALLTLAVPFILAAVARLWGAIDGGQGLVVPVPQLPDWLAFREFLFLVTLVIAVASVALAYAIWHSRFGWALAAIRDHEDVAEQLGVATFRWKMLVIAATGAIGGVAGSAWALQYGFVQVEVVFSLTIPLFVIVMAVLGGRTHWLGPVIGAAVIVLMQDRLAGGGFEGWRLIIFGGLLAAMVIFAPGGLWARLRARPVPVLLAGAVTLVVLAVVPGTGAPLDWLAIAMLVSAVVAFWPAGWLPPALRHRITARSGGDVAAKAGGVAGGDAESEPESEPEREPGGADGGTPGAGTPSLQDPHNLGDLAGSGSREHSDVGDLAGPGPGPGSGPAAGEVVVECHDLARHYGGVRALDGLDLQIRQGELVALVGPNGSGKTTLVNLLSGAVRPSRGGFRVAGRRADGLPPHLLTHRGIARTYQIPRPFESMTVRDNVAVALMFGRSPRGQVAARAQALQHLAFVGLASLADAYPSEINLHQRQLLEMARALATSPRLLLLDEALAGLNPAEIDNAVQVVRRIHAAGVTIVIVEHLLRVVNQLASRVVVLDRGRLLADGDPRQVMSDPAVVAAYLGKSSSHA
jgi:branched-chain amino acid transport system permease protein